VAGGLDLVQAEAGAGEFAVVVAASQAVSGRMNPKGPIP
jgi:hypothetical protein